MKKPRQFRIDEELLARFDRVNEKLAANGSEVIRRMIEDYVAEKEIEIEKGENDMSRYKYDVLCRSIMKRAHRYIAEEALEPDKAVWKAVDWFGHPIDRDSVEYLILQVKQKEELK